MLLSRKNNFLLARNVFICIRKHNFVFICQLSIFQYNSSIYKSYNEIKYFYKNLFLFRDIPHKRKTFLLRNQVRV